MKPILPNARSHMYHHWRQRCSSNVWATLSELARAKPRLLRRTAGTSLCAASFVGWGWFTRYSMDNSFSVVERNKLFLLVMAVGSIVGTFIGGLLLGLIPNYILLPVLAALLLFSAVMIWRHG